MTCVPGAMLGIRQLYHFGIKAPFSPEPVFPRDFPSKLLFNFHLFLPQLLSRLTFNLTIFNYCVMLTFFVQYKSVVIWLKTCQLNLRQLDFWSAGLKLSSVKVWATRLPGSPLRVRRKTQLHETINPFHTGPMIQSDICLPKSSLALPWWWRLVRRSCRRRRWWVGTRCCPPSRWCSGPWPRPTSAKPLRWELATSV